MQEYVMGNGAIALGALAAGVNLVAGYPGTPSSEILETISKYRHDGVYIEWSVNEKAAMEVAAAAAYSGARAMVTMKQVGLNVAADPLFVALHQAPWNEAVPATESFSLKKVAASLLKYRFDTTFDLVYFDASAPDAQPELWTREVFAKLFAALHSEGVLVTYSAKGMVKENLRAAGFEVHRLPGALGKHHMLRAVKR